MEILRQCCRPGEETTELASNLLSALNGASVEKETRGVI